MIKEICSEIDKVVDGTERDHSHLRELILEVIKNEKDFPQKFVDMIYDIHEDDSFTAESEKEAKENNLHPPQQFVDFLKEIKEKNKELWLV